MRKSHFENMENQKEFMDEVAKKLNIKNPSDWGKIRTQQIFNLGGQYLIIHYYGGSVYRCLKSVYKGANCLHSLTCKDVHWKREWFSNLPKSYWESLENRKEFLDEVATKLQIKKSSDWGNVSIATIHELGGGSLLSGYFNNSLIDCLQSVYSSILHHFLVNSKI